VWRWAARWFDDTRFPRTVFVLAVVVLSVPGLIRLHLNIAFGYDMGIFFQAVRHYAHFQAPIVTIKGDGFNLFADHFHPIIALWAPLLWLWDNARALVIGQALVVAAAAWPVWRYARRHLEGAAWPRVATALVLLGWPVWTLVSFDVHEIAFAVPLLAWAIDALDRRSARGLLAAGGWLLLVREDMGALVAVMGFVWLAWHGPGRRTRSDWAVGLGLVAGGVAAFALVTGVLIPNVAPDGYQYWDYPALGDGPGGALLGVLRRPWRVVALLFWPAVKAQTWVVLLAPWAFLPLRSPYVLLAAPIMAERMLSARENLWGLFFHYNAPVWIVLGLAAVDAYRRLSPDWRAPARLGAFFAAIASALYALFTVVGATLALPASEPGWRDRAPAIASVPPDTCVVSDSRFAAAFVATNRVTLPGVSRLRQDFAVLDVVHGYDAPAASVQTSQEAYAAALAAGFREVGRFGGIVVLQAPDYAGPDPARCGPGAP